MPDRRAWRDTGAAAAVSCAVGAGISMAGTGAVAIVVALVAVPIALGFLRVAVPHQRLTRGLLRQSTATELVGTRVQVGPHAGAAFVAGLTRPEIFCDRGLVHGLTEAELRAVTLHERAHQLARDPLRVAAVAAVAPLVSRLASGRAWLAHLAARREIAADRYAMDLGVSRAAIASAMLKVSAVGPVHATGFSGATELRLRALLGDVVAENSRGVHPGWLLVGVALGGAACAVLLHPAVLALAGLEACCP